ncbi:hypothetical protein FKG94_06955 [Exilibacterium tricleocarpae]|uniref:Uncharacterized protein n=1 Tax=Exilibacterium tricleocarpae TaxID=2591008 RepID=A0A545TZ43_9GAMM|nr:hypothetical protein [Exilibacterium tricleocarpae]TQV82474.1 hypothetical protein FKG94_06955 [Exilibacterium tricleocarpae]
MKRISEDRLYELLPLVYRLRDAEQGEHLKALLRVITEQVNVVEDNISQLYENWFIETSEDWAVPYIGDLVGYEPVREAGEPGAAETGQGRERNKILIPRREIANTLRYRRRKGTLALLELLSNDVAGWPARAVEFYRLLNRCQAINHLGENRAQTADLRSGGALDLLDGPFEQIAHNADIRRINSRHTFHHTPGRHNIPSVGVFVWRLRSYPVTKTPAYCLESVAARCFTFSVLGNDAPLFVRPEAEADPSQIAGEFNLPVAMRRRFFEDHKSQLYGEGKSLHIWVGKKKPRGKEVIPEPVPLDSIVAADLSDWQYLPKRGYVAVDPLLGRIAFPARQFPKNGVWVNYHYGFSMDLGGGEYERSLIQPEDCEIFRVGRDEAFATIRGALEKWNEDAPRHAVIEITDSGVYAEQLNVSYREGQESLQIRAANRQRPVLRLLDWQTDRPDSLTVNGMQNNRFTLDGVMITGRGVQVSGAITELTLRHSTLVPGWSLGSDCGPQRATESSLEIFSPRVCVTIEHSIIGSIQVNPALIDVEAPARDEGDEVDEQTLAGDEASLAACKGIGEGVRLDPIRLCISDSIVDATDREFEAIGAPGCPVAHACLTIRRSTVFGRIHAHAIELGENTLFDGRISVARRQQGCLRFSYIAPGSRTPKRYRCQPDLVENAVDVPALNPADKEAAKERERLRVRPRFNSVRYGMPTYCQLAVDCAEEIKGGADDESEMGAFHDLYQPQRMANLRVRLDEYLPARMDINVILAD